MFLFLDENTCCGYSLEAPRRGASNEYPQYISSRNKKNTDTFMLKKKRLIKSNDYDKQRRVLMAKSTVCQNK